MLPENTLILLYQDERHKYLIPIGNDKFHTDKGFINFSDLKTKNFGDTVTTNKDEIFYILQPSLYDKVMKVHRKTQIIYPKDIGIIIMYSNIFPGATVIESGVGSGALTTALANFVGPTGKVISYERNEDFAKNTEKNLLKNGLNEPVTIKLREMTEELTFDEENVDFVMIDIGSPWDLIKPAYKALKPGCRMSSICPTFEQLTKTVFKMQEIGFTNIESMEIQLRKILVREGKTRPEQRMPCHTGWLIFGNKINKTI
ncbi:MAG: tRNA (adenine-N1)-methyltransferase [Candidatus Omnitrophota bacterium]